ncbi:MAG: hypothetical protein ACK5W9_03790 [Bdellovibrionales bacterium]
MSKRKVKKGTTNITLLKLKGTPFKSAGDMKKIEDQLLMEEWQSIERAKIRRELLMKEANKKILAPLLNGFKAKFTGKDGAHENLVRVYLTHDDSIQVDIDNELKSNDTNGSMESLVRSLIEGLMGGYLSALGLKKESIISENSGRSEKKTKIKL